ncbi:hypothetical protein D8I35_05485 [Corticibacter populi]|uniref:Uncharacterized protein n=1 Tax=Corticibacter populi TaxID=1550736 RepID=A0A3M6R0W1_9BURK|nr:hypothetical protein D8I35_05485 [Corticibacter populi]
MALLRTPAQVGSWLPGVLRLESGRKPAVSVGSVRRAPQYARGLEYGRVSFCTEHIQHSLYPIDAAGPIYERLPCSACSRMGRPAVFVAVPEQSGSARLLDAFAPLLRERFVASKRADSSVVVTVDFLCVVHAVLLLIKPQHRLPMLWFDPECALV